MDKTLQLMLPNTLANAIAATAAAEGKMVNEVAIEAIQRDLSRNMLQRMRRDAEARRGNMTDAEVNEVVLRSIHELRQGGESSDRA